MSLLFFTLHFFHSRVNRSLSLETDLFFCSHLLRFVSKGKPPSQQESKSFRGTRASKMKRPRRRRETTFFSTKTQHNTTQHNTPNRHAHGTFPLSSLSLSLHFPRLVYFNVLSLSFPFSSHPPPLDRFLFSGPSLCVFFPLLFPHLYHLYSLHPHYHTFLLVLVHYFFFLSSPFPVASLDTLS